MESAKASPLAGFVLIEIMVVIAIIGILVSVVVPGYQQHVLRSYRLEASGELLKIAGLQQQIGGLQRQYASQ